MKKLLVKLYIKMRDKIKWMVHYLRLKRRVHFVYKYILDKESKRIMKLRARNILHNYNRDVEHFIKDVVKLGKEFEIPELNENINIILCQTEKSLSAKKRLHYTQILLDHSKYRNHYKCVSIEDDFEINEGVVLVPIWGDNKKPDAVLLRNRLVGGVLHFPVYGPVLLGVVGKQYFDIFEAAEQEVIVDCGACDGTTELEIANWTDFSYKKIFAFEPEKDNCKKCLAFYEKNKLPNVELIEKGTWSKEDIFLFNKGTDGMNAGGSLQAYGTEKVFVTSIDDVVGEERVTFIKMDVEGAELESLKGAAMTIRKNAPRLAICIYHKESDLWEIPQYILQLNKNYRFYIRHYTSYFYETVLYAEVL